MVTPIVSSKYRHLYQLCYIKIFSTDQDGNLMLLNDPGRVRSQKTNVVCQIQRFDFECILVVSQKVIIVNTNAAGLRFKTSIRMKSFCKKDTREQSYHIFKMSRRAGR